MELKKYSSLTQWLSGLAANSVSITFRAIEEIIKSDLPASSRRHRPWWGNEVRAGGRQCAAWLIAGWRVTCVDLITETVVFSKT
jgi:hypothetical protein